MRLAILSDVPALLHRYQKFLESVLLLCER